MHRLFNILAAALLTGLLGTMVFGATEANQLRIATQPIPQYAPIFVAKEKKWIEEELKKSGINGVAVKWSSFAAGPPINESFASGQQDVGFMGDTPAIIAKAAGINTRVIGLSASGPKAFAVVVPTNSTVKTAKDLKGKRVAVVKGSYAHHLLVLVLQKGGLTTNDVEIINLSQADIATAIASGNIDAAAIWEPLITKLESQRIVRVLADGTGIKKGVLVIVATNDFAVRQREQSKALLRAYQRGAKFIKSNPKEAAKLIAADVNLPADFLTRVFGKLDFHPAIQSDDVQELKKSEAFMRSAGLIKAPVNIDSFVDVSLPRDSGIK